MREFLKEIYPQLSYREGDVFVIKIIPFYRKTGFVLAQKTSNTPPEKPRPVIIIEKHREELKLIALSKNKNYQNIRPSIFLKDFCTFPESRCLGIKLNTDSPNYIFGKPTASGKIRFFYPINMHILSLLEEEGSARYCGKCSKELSHKIEKLISELGVDYV